MTASASTVLTYSIAGGDTEGVFTVNQNSGTITTTKQLDREDAAEYHLTLVAQVWVLSPLISTLYNEY